MRKYKFLSGGDLFSSLSPAITGGLIPPVQTDTALQQGAKSTVSSMVDQAIPGLGTGLSAVDAYAQQKKDIECIPDPSSPTGETCFDTTTGIKKGLIDSSALRISFSIINKFTNCF